MTHQVTFLTTLAKEISIGLCSQQAVVEAVVKLTESIATHPKNLSAMCNGLETVISSEIFMNSARNCLKQVLLDKHIQKIIGVSLSGVSKVALNKTFKWKKNDDAESDDELMEEREREPEKDPPLVCWIKNVQNALDKQRKSVQVALQPDKPMPHSHRRLSLGENVGEGGAAAEEEQKKPSNMTER